MSTAEQILSKAGVSNVRDQILAAHSKMDKTRCIGWLRESGYRPKIEAVTLATGPQPLVRRVEPRPDEGCHVHPFVET